jgi:GrpB-like predicted nucleotidyltransferase (UPF0157 family)
MERLEDRIGRDAAGRRTRHIHMVEAGFREHRERLLFRDYLIVHPEAARRCQELKLEPASRHAEDRAAYARGKEAFIDEATAAAREESAGRNASKHSPGMRR